ncbi:hypothetical protein LAUMK40_01925 [Mycobacterium kansasii]|nr:hypothetical protein LAUMK40_01925 [Mycobacterium kansasii]
MRPKRNREHGGCGCGCGGGQLRNGLARQCGVRVALPVVAVVERNIALIALTHRDRRGAFAGVADARRIANAADVVRRVLRHPAVQVAGGAVGVVLPRRHSALLGRQVAGGARRRQVESHVEAEEDALVALLGVAVGHADRLNGGHRLGQQHQQLLDGGVIADRNLTDADQIGQQHRQCRIDPVEQLPDFRGGRARLLQHGPDGGVVALQPPAEVGQTRGPLLYRIRRVGLRIQHRLGLVDQGE